MAKRTYIIEDEIKFIDSYPSLCKRVPDHKKIRKSLIRGEVPQGVIFDKTPIERAISEKGE